MKVVVYAICKDEEQFADRWMDSMGEADEVVVLDTGSSDGTVERLRARGARVERGIISPWRFDDARNRSLELVPEDADLCVCTDLDEVFHPGWRAALEQAWVPDDIMDRSLVLKADIAHVLEHLAGTDAGCNDGAGWGEGSCQP